MDSGERTPRQNGLELRRISAIGMNTELANWWGMGSGSVLALIEVTTGGVICATYWRWQASAGAGVSRMRADGALLAVGRQLSTEYARGADDEADTRRTRAEADRLWKPATQSPTPSDLI